jgi:DMSO/TMAO reductase YedYZ molybdopterin-dependent catalytic subunit
MPIMRTVTADPWNAEAPLSALRGECTPTEAFYVRNNFVPPVLNEATWRLRVGGAIDRPLELDLAFLCSLHRVERRVTLECAGNGRRLLEPPAPGTQWGLGAAGTAIFTGTPLAGVLEAAGVGSAAVECLFTGADSGPVPERGVVPFQRSLPIDFARGDGPLSDGPLLAWAMNGAPLTRDHGFPLRLVVPGWYAVASVKWLVGIELIERPFTGHFQLDRYVYMNDGRILEPVAHARVRSLVTSPAAGATVRAGACRVEGVAWSGAHPIVRVDVSIDDDRWHAAVLAGESRAGEAVDWSHDASLTPGPHRIRARATDASGATQPLDPAWNELGYGNNVVQSVDVVALG